MQRYSWNGIKLTLFTVRSGVAESTSALVVNAFSTMHTSHCAFAIYNRKQTVHLTMKDIE